MHWLRRPKAALLALCLAGAWIPATVITCDVPFIDIFIRDRCCDDDHFRFFDFDFEFDD